MDTDLLYVSICCNHLFAGHDVALSCSLNVYSQSVEGSYELSNKGRMHLTFLSQWTDSLDSSLSVSQWSDASGLPLFLTALVIASCQSNHSSSSPWKVGIGTVSA